ncbi:hypothetical protein KM043_017762 [Ampulex compressa]|nr:hypothetical protein KM043_017762 [Ampulex compressa]
MGQRKQHRNLMNELMDIFCEIESLKPEPEVCNVTCPPLGCPQGPCPGMCCYEGICDSCCVSKMPRCPPSPHSPRCCSQPCLKNVAETSSCPRQSRFHEPNVKENCPRASFNDPPMSCCSSPQPSCDSQQKPCYPPICSMLYLYQ